LPCIRCAWSIRNQITSAGLEELSIKIHRRVSSFGWCLRPSPDRSEQRTDQPETTPASSPSIHRRLPLPRLPRSGEGWMSQLLNGQGNTQAMFNSQEEGSKWGEPVGRQSIPDVLSEPEKTVPVPSDRGASMPALPSQARIDSCWRWSEPAVGSRAWSRRRFRRSGCSSIRKQNGGVHADNHRTGFSCPPGSACGC